MKHVVEVVVVVVVVVVVEVEPVRGMRKYTVDGE